MILGSIYRGFNLRLFIVINFFLCMIFGVWKYKYLLYWIYLYIVYWVFVIYLGWVLFKEWNMFNFGI